MNFTKYFNHTYKLIAETIYPKPKKFIYVAMGDSTAEGLGASHPDKSFASLIYLSIKEHKKDSGYHNLGLQQSRVVDVLQNQLERAIKLQPDLITLSIGANDLKHNTPIRSFEKSLSTILSRLKNETNALVVINTIPDVSSAPIIPQKLKTITNLLVKRYNRIITQLASDLNVHLVDFYTQSRIFAKAYPELMFSTDRYHPSDFGYALWANTIITHIQDTIFEKKPLFHWSR